ncbi:MAG: CBS domain-containing protein [Deferribacterota bacterium]|nr:CBS domain-containing protein [Deferribacterota bacterium]
MTATVLDIINKKGSKIYSVDVNDTAFYALELMADKDIGCVAVLEEGRVVGLFTERDYARKVILRGRSSKETTVDKLMSTDILYVTPDERVDNCMALMTTKKTRYLLVLDGDKLMGIISIGDVLAQVISDCKFTVRELEKYISGDFGS